MENLRNFIGSRAGMDRRARWVGAWIVLLVVAAAVQATPTQAATYYVANNGLDSSPCTKTMPCRSIGRALTVAPAGSKIEVGPGIYGDINHSGTVGDYDGEETPASYCMININNPVTLVSKDGAGSTVLDAGGSANHLVCIYASGVVFGKLNKGFTVRNGLDGVQVDSSTTGVAVVGNLATHTDGYGFLIRGSAVLAKNNIGATPVPFWIETPGGVVTGNLATNAGSSAPGFQIAGHVATVVTRNVALNNDLGFWIEPMPFAQMSPALSFTKNTAAGNRWAGVWVRSAAIAPDSITLTQNNFFGNGEGPPLLRPVANCGLWIDSVSPGLTVTATGNYWGTATGPGANPADLAGGACNGGSGITLTTTPFAKAKLPLYPPRMR